ncbi:MAG: hypothetical protein WD603_02355 [Patescibacteria group bacterium]
MVKQKNKTPRLLCYYAGMIRREPGIAAELHAAGAALEAAPQWLQELPIENTDRVINAAHREGVPPADMAARMAGRQTLHAS